MSSSGSATRCCSRQTCARDAIMTLTYVYSDSTAVVGPLAGHAEPHAYDLCGVHADRLTVPRGWRVVRLELPETRARREDIGAVADREPEPPAPVRERPRAVLRDVSLPRPTGTRTPPETTRTSAPESPREPRPAAPAVPRPEATRPAAPESARAADRQPGTAEAWHDVPVPGSLRRPHLRRPTARGGTGFPQD